METLKNFWSQITQSSVWQAVFSHLQWIDWLVLFAIIFGFFGGLRKGLTRAFFEALTVAAALVLTLAFYTQAAALLRPTLDFLSEDMLGLAGYAAVALVTLLVLRFVFWGLLFLLPALNASLIESGLAVIFNVLSKLLMLSLIARGILIGPWGGLKQVFGSGDSYTGYLLIQLSQSLQVWTQGPLNALRSALAG